jgi:serine/threonine-protein kinase
MELVQGKPLSAIARKAAKDMNPLTPALSAYIVAQAANGLGYAHDLVDSEGRQLGVVHRDVSPQNILVSFEGAVKVIDFGIARALGRVSHTNPGGLKGKIEYMSPEQASSEDVDRRADVFALGVVLWEAVTGRHLFRRETELATMRAIVDEPIPPPSDITPVAPQLEAIIMQALQKRREDRFQTAQEMAIALERYAFAAEGFSPLQLANYLKGLFDVEFAQWKKTVSSALDIEAKPGLTPTQSGTKFPVLTELPTRGPTVALRPGSSSQIRRNGLGSDAGFGRETTDLKTGAPTRRDRLWVYGGIAAVALTAIGGSVLLSKPRSAIPPAPVQSGKFARWQGTPPPPTAVPTPPPAPAEPVVQPAPPAPSAIELVGPTPGVSPAPAPEPTKAEPTPSRARAEKPRSRSHAPRRTAPQAPAVPSDHRPNPFD